LELEANLRWFAYMLVHKRVALENTHQNPMISTYFNLLVKMNKKLLFTVILKETYSCINRFIILGIHEKILNQTKNILKNLGVWLGLLTLAREKPIVMKYLNIKNLLVDAFHKDKLSFILPMVCKILEQSKGSTVFKLNNPWLSVLLSLLSEIHDQDIKTNIRCEIQILFKNLEYQNTTVSSKFLARLSPKPPLPLAPVKNNPIIKPAAPVGANLAPVGPVQQLKIAQLPDYITIDEKNLAEFLKDGFDMKMVVAQAVESAIKEIIPPVVSRSVTIALITTRQLALKDFSLENDERKILRGAHLIVQNLSGSLALVTCREPLRIALCELLKEGLQGRGFDEEAVEKIVKITSLDNLDLGCALIKKAVIEKALEDVNTDQTIIEILKKRKLAREKGEQYYDEKYVRMTQFLPEQLRPQIGGLTEEQLKIYEDFGNVQKKGPQSPLTIGRREEDMKEDNEEKRCYREKVLEKLDISKNFLLISFNFNCSAG
jgi:CCR4-NOT transcription complex subunit 1